MTVEYNGVLNSLFQAVEEGFEDIFADKAEEIQRRVNRVHERFFKKLVMKAIDVKSAPNLGEYTPVWEPLSSGKTGNGGYLAKKKRLGQSSNFFIATGELKTAMQRLISKTVLGTPLVSFTPTGFVGAIGTRGRLEQWKGRADKRKVIRNAKGQFAKVENVRRRVTASIFVDPYPKILEDITKTILDESKYFDDDEIAKKLKTPKGNRVRPMFTNFLNWFLDVEIRKAIRV